MKALLVNGVMVMVPRLWFDCSFGPFPVDDAAPVDVAVLGPVLLAILKDLM
jgi:hypothetical protein